MKRLPVLIVLATFLLVQVAFAQDNETFDVTRDPVIPHAPDGLFTDSGAVFYHDGLFHMFRNVFPTWPAPVDIFYMTSEDGYTWETVSPDPVIVSDGNPFDATAVLASSAIVREDGTWVLYLYTFTQMDTTTRTTIIGATADNPLGPWEFTDTLLEPDVVAWSNYRVGSPSVVKIDDQFVMFFEAISVQFTYAIGLATSHDGLIWTKKADPVFTPTLNTGDFDAFVVHQPRVVQTADGLVMMYRAFVGQENFISYGLARSTDNGLNWERLSNKPFYGVDYTPRGRSLWWTSLVVHDGLLYGFFEIADSTGATNIHVGTLGLNS